MKRYTLLTADMDGTVLNTRKEITPRTAGAIHQALADGWEVLFATGRCLAEVRPYLTDFPDMHYLLCHSGATVTDLRTGQDLCSLPIDPETVERVLAVTADADAAAVFFLGNELYIEERFRGRMPYFGCQCFEALYEKCAHWVPDRGALLAEHILDVRKLNFFFHDHAEWLRCGEVFRTMPLEYASGIPNNFEITAPGVSKGEGLRLLCRTLGLDIRQTIACGDEGNDVSILRAAGLGVAMGNATAEALAAADVQVADCDHDGVAQAIETYLGRSIPTESEECAQDQNTAPTGEAADAENLLSGATPTSGRKEARP